MKKPYHRKLNYEKQIRAEERIASMIYDNEEIDTWEETANALSRDILYEILREFRPDLFETKY